MPWPAIASWPTARSGSTAGRCRTGASWNWRAAVPCCRSIPRWPSISPGCRSPRWACSPFAASCRNGRCNRLPNGPSARPRRLPSPTGPTPFCRVANASASSWRGCSLSAMPNTIPGPFCCSTSRSPASTSRTSMPPLPARDGVAADRCDYGRLAAARRDHHERIVVALAKVPVHRLDGGLLVVTKFHVCRSPESRCVPNRHPPPRPAPRAGRRSASRRGTRLPCPPNRASP